MKKKLIPYTNKYLQPKKKQFLLRITFFSVEFLGSKLDVTKNTFSQIQKKTPSQQIKSYSSHL